MNVAACWHLLCVLCLCSVRMWNSFPEHNFKDCRWCQCHSWILALAGQPSPATLQFSCLWGHPHQWAVGYDSCSLHFEVSVLHLWVCCYDKSRTRTGQEPQANLHFLTIFIISSFSNTTPPWILYFGRETQSGPNVNEENRTVSRIIVHPHWNNTLLNNDIALMKLSSPVNFTDYITPICLASNSSQFHNGTYCYSTGWGRLTNTSECASVIIIDNVLYSILYISMTDISWKIYHIDVFFDAC